MGEKPIHADVVEVRKSLRKIRKRLDYIRKEIRRRRNRNALWKF